MIVETETSAFKAESFSWKMGSLRKKTGKCYFAQFTRSISDKIDQLGQNPHTTLVLIVQFRIYNLTTI